MFEVEKIPDEAKVFYRVHKMFIVDGEIIPQSFREQGEGDKKSMSTDWEKYSSPLLSRNRAKIPEDNAIISFVVNDLRSETLRVEHSPTEEIKLEDGRVIPPNQAHTDVKSGKKEISSEEIRLKLSDHMSIELELED